MSGHGLSVAESLACLLKQGHACAQIKLHISAHVVHVYAHACLLGVAGNSVGVVWAVLVSKSSHVSMPVGEVKMRPSSKPATPKVARTALPQRHEVGSWEREGKAASFFGCGGFP